MQSSTGVSHLFLILLVQLLPAQISPKPGDAALKGMTLHDVLTKSICHPMEQLFDVEQEFPGDVDYVYIPDCVSLWRCSGCCLDESLVCRPTLERNITLQVMKIHPQLSSHLVELTFVEHQACECRIRQSQSNSGSLKKKHGMRKHKKTAKGCGKCQSPQDN